MTSMQAHSGERASDLKLAYLTGEYPRATDTFIQREVAALRRLGAHVKTFSVRRTGEEHRVGPEQQEEYERTSQILPAARSPVHLVRSHLAMLIRSPRAYLGALGLAYKTAPPGVRGALFQAFYFAEAGVLASELRARELGHLHNHFADSSCTVAMLAATMAEIPFSFSLHGPGIFFEAYRWRLDEKLRRAAFVRCISHFCRSQAMLLSVPERWDRFRVIHCGVEPSLYVPRAVDPEGSRILFVGRLVPAKGLLILFQALATIKEKVPSVSLELVGAGPHQEALERRAAELGLSDRIAFRGYESQERVRERLRQADLLVLPSFAEGLPVVLMEAMAAGVPVVASRLAGVPELVEDGASGFLVPPGDALTLASRILELLSDVEKRRQFARAGRAKVEEEFNVSLEAAKLRSVFEEFRAREVFRKPALMPPVSCTR